jgi:hypothetical protein
MENQEFGYGSLNPKSRIIDTDPDPPFELQNKKKKKIIKIGQNWAFFR